MSDVKFSGSKMELSPVQLAGRYERLRKDNVYKDVTLTSHDNVVSAHKCVLSIGSHFFELLFQQAENKQNLCYRSSFELVGLGQDDAKHLDAVIDFLYSGIIYMNDINFMGIMQLAEYLAINELLDLGEKYLVENVSKENCLKLYLDMKKSLNGEALKGTNQSNRIHELMNLVWEMVETHFYDYIIDNHEFQEMLPEEIENLLQTNFNMEKVLNLAVRWMKTRPLDFTFAESLINISYSQLDTAANLELTTMSQTQIVNSIETAREQLLSRRVPESNSVNMLRKLKEIQRLFDENYVESDNDDDNGEVDMEQGESGEDADTVEIYVESGVTGVKDVVGVRDISEHDGIDQAVAFERNCNDKQEVQNTSKNVITECLDEIAENASEVCAEQNRENCSIITEKEVDSTNKQLAVENNGNSHYSMSDAVEELKKKSSEANPDIHKIDISIEGDAVADLGGNIDSNSVQVTLNERNDFNDEDHAIEEVKVEDNCIDVLGMVGLMENKKIDGTEQEVPHSDLKLAEAVLQDRVTECLELMMKSVKTEKDDVTVVTRIKPVTQRRARGRPRKYFNAVQEDNLKLRIKSSRTKTRGAKRKATYCYTEKSGSELDEPDVKVETRQRNVIESKTDKMDIEMTDDTTAGENKDEETEEIEGDSEDDIEDDVGDDYASEKVFDDILKQTPGSDVNDSEYGKKVKKRKPRKPGHHECEVCNKVYSQKYRLNQHMNKHMGIKPYKCVVCSQFFTRTDHVIRHMKSQHADMSMFKCDECDEEFEKPNDIVSHSVNHSLQNDDVDEKSVQHLQRLRKNTLQFLVRIQESFSMNV